MNSTAAKTMAKDGLQTSILSIDDLAEKPILLPKDVQESIIAKLSPIDVARTGMASRSFKVLAERGPQWADMLAGPNQENILSERPKLTAISKISKAMHGPKSRRVLQVALNTTPPPRLSVLLESSDLLEAQLLDWQDTETELDKKNAAKTVCRLRRAKASMSDSLDLSGLVIRTLPPWIGQLRQLKTANLTSCTSITVLPESIGQLGELQELKLSGCTSITALPESIGQLGELQELKLSGCTSITALPESIGQLTRLMELYLENCTSLLALPEVIGHLRQLAALRINNCTSVTVLPGTVGQLTQLFVLNLSGCTSIEALPKSVEQLAQLRGPNLRLSYPPQCRRMPLETDPVAK